MTRVSPSPKVLFRSAPQGRDMNLRENPQLSAPSATTKITKPNPPTPDRSVTAKVKPVEPAESKKPKTPEPATVVARIPDPLRSVLPPRNEPPASALPIGGSELALQPTTFTPYDRYLSTVRAVISNLETQPVDMGLVARLMKQGRGFRYSLRDPYRADPPSVTAARRAGDCKSKSLWLYDNLGDYNALFVIGKVSKRAKTSHAWVYWRYDGRWWILDCTERAEPIAADSVSADRYVAYYSFGKTGTFRHKATRMILTSALHPSASPVADKR